VIYWARKAMSASTGAHACSRRHVGEEKGLDIELARGLIKSNHSKFYILYSSLPFVTQFSSIPTVMLGYSHG
jgi:hypothetical protein